jgi:hypothetical protein
VEINERNEVILRSNADYLMEVPVEMGYYRQSVGLIKSNQFGSTAFLENWLG